MGDSRTHSPSRLELEARNLAVRYSPGLEPALGGVSMGVPVGSMYAVLGPNGAGKSTLLRALLGLVRPESGQALLGDRASGSWAPRDRARRVGVVPQNETISFPLRARDLVAMGRYPYLGPLAPASQRDDAVVAEALARCDVAGLADRYVDTLSGGELQRVRLARALAQEPQTLVLDEPTASLDLRHEMEILHLLKGEAEGGRTVFYTTHHLDLAARFADHILLLHRGKVMAEGSPAEVLQAEMVGRVFGWPVTVTADPVAGTPRITPLDPAPLREPQPEG